MKCRQKKKKKKKKKKFISKTPPFHITNSQPHMLIVANGSRDKMMPLIKKLEQDMSKEINYTIMDEKEFGYRQEIADVSCIKYCNLKK